MFQVQQHLPNNQDIQRSLEFMCTLHHIHPHHLLDQVIAADPQHKIQEDDEDDINFIMKGTIEMSIQICYMS
jgi:hypothetical protein